ncbi:MAG: LPS export ABC transporter ATP-binding protein [Desulfobacterales bacterium]|nr:LPS export ABC transporter ATP-binding protein [Desulfobacterales bacterium]MDJ0914987.1 LPS export ABC transporter ATP-binding protein [Desulfobacterales bacterium]
MANLRLANLAKSYNHRRVVNSISIGLTSGEVVGLLGPNGAGKTTTFYMATGLIKPDEGQVFLDEEDITPFPMYMRARKGIGYLPQESSVFRKLSVLDNMMLIIETLPLSKSDGKERAYQLLDELGIKQLAKQKAGVLSGGERRRLEISRALITDPFFILLDEPFAGIDPLAVNDIKKIIQHLKDRGIGVLISDHNVRETLGVCDSGYIIHEGTVCVSGTPEEIATNDVACQVYLGDEFQL